MNVATHEMRKNNLVAALFHGMARNLLVDTSPLKSWSKRRRSSLRWSFDEG